jgi:hypothetical protein
MADLTALLAPLARLAARFPDVEGVVIWGDDTGWEVQDDTTELLDAEEIAFYAEGLLQEGFGLLWHAMAEAEAPKEPDHVLLMFWQAGTAPPPPPGPPPGWRVMAEGRLDCGPGPG